VVTKKQEHIEMLKRKISAYKARVKELEAELRAAQK
jgi:hypothetical protein